MFVKGFSIGCIISAVIFVAIHHSDRALAWAVIAIYFLLMSRDIK